MSRGERQASEKGRRSSGKSPRPREDRAAAKVTVSRDKKRFILLMVGFTALVFLRVWKWKDTAAKETTGDIRKYFLPRCTKNPLL